MPTIVLDRQDLIHFMWAMVVSTVVLLLQIWIPNIFAMQDDFLCGKTEASDRVFENTSSGRRGDRPSADRPFLYAFMECEHVLVKHG